MLTTHTAAPRVDPFLTALRRLEFARLDQQRLAYCDYAGSGLYAESQITAHQALLAEGIFGNPHSESLPSLRSTSILDEARAHVLSFLDADPEQYLVCFTANSSAAIKLVAESYPWNGGSSCVLTADNHNSVNGVREYARRAGARLTYVPLDEELRLRDAQAVLRAARGKTRSFFAFPAQSNFSGVRHPLTLVGEARALGYDVLLDAAAFLPTNSLSLRQVPADFVVLSFYKLFGYPTGVGALVARRDAVKRLRRPWFAGGTVDYVSVQSDRHQLRPDSGAFEDGTPNFLGVSALADGFALLERVGIGRINAHVANVTSAVLDALIELAHDTGTPLVRLYGPRDMRDRGGTIAFNVRSRDGAVVPYPEVERRARDARVALRCGCFCNPGASEAAFGFDAQRATACMRRLGEQFTIQRFAECMGADATVGAVRVSFGIANCPEDVARLVAVLASFAE